MRIIDPDVVVDEHLDRPRERNGIALEGRVLVGQAWYQDGPLQAPDGAFQDFVGSSLWPGSDCAIRICYGRMVSVDRKIAKLKFQKSLILFCHEKSNIKGLEAIGVQYLRLSLDKQFFYFLFF